MISCNLQFRWFIVGLIKVTTDFYPESGTFGTAVHNTSLSTKAH